MTYAIDDIDQFLAQAIQLERDAARRFEDLMHAMHTAGNRDVEALFRRLGEFSRRHLESAVARGGFRELPRIGPNDIAWPEDQTPEAARWRGADSALDVRGALELALEGERAGHDYYAAVAEQTRDPEVRAMALEFAEEEAQHVAELERWIHRHVA